MRVLFLDIEFNSIPGYPDYYHASKCGKILSTAYNKRRLLSQWVNANGYLESKLGRKHLSVHRAVALTYINNPSSLSDVNHIDGDKLNNRLSNLEWCSRADNIYHSLRTGLHDQEETPVVGVNVDTGDGVWLVSQAEGKKVGFTQPLINKCLKGLRSLHKRYQWSYA